MSNKYCTNIELIHLFLNQKLLKCAILCMVCTEMVVAQAPGLKEIVGLTTIKPKRSIKKIYTEVEIDLSSNEYVIKLQRFVGDVDIY